MASDDGNDGSNAEVMFQMLSRAEDSDSDSDSMDTEEEQEEASGSDGEAAEDVSSSSESEDYSTDEEYRPTEEELDSIKQNVQLEEPLPEDVNAAYICLFCRNLIRVCAECSNCSCTTCYPCKLEHDRYCVEREITPFCSNCKKENCTVKYNQLYQKVIDELAVQCTLCNRPITFGNFYEHVHLSCREADERQRIRAALAQRDLDSAISELTGKRHGVQRSVTTRRRSSRRRSNRARRTNDSHDNSMGQPQQQRQPRVATREHYMRIYTARLSGDFPQYEKVHSLYAAWNKHLLAQAGLPRKPPGLTDEYVLQWQAGVRAQRRLPHESSSMAEAANAADDVSADPDYTPTEQE